MADQVSCMEAAAGDGNGVPGGRPLRRSTLACSRCRQQKMKCSGGAPPCDRCRKANSHCVFEPPAPPPSKTVESSSQVDTQPLIVCASATTRQPRDLTDRNGHNSNPNDPNGSFILNSQPHLPLHRVPPLGTSGPEFVLSPPDSNGFSRQKRRRISGGLNVNVDAITNDTDVDSSACDRDMDMSDGASPYQTVKAFEVSYWRANGLEGTAPRTPTSATGVEPRPTPGLRLPLEAMFPRSTTDREPLLYCLSEIGISIEDARDMFSLFGERVASFMPGLYDADFTDLPNDPIYALAGIKVMARYLPGVNALRSRVDQVLQKLLRNILFDNLRRPFEAALESMRGLAVLYGYSDVGVARSQLDTQQSKADALSIKGIIEGYAVRRNIGRAQPSNVLGCILWLWLYTMSTHYVMLLSLPATLSADEHLHKVIGIVKQAVSHPQIAVLLGEVDLCRIAQSRRMGMHTAGLTDAPRNYDDWQQVWGAVESQAVSVGRRLRFHFRFAMFYQHRRSQGPVSTDKDMLGAAQAFLHCITKLSPVAKGRIKYMCGFGFVMLVSVCCYILRALDAQNPHSVDASHQAACLDDIRDVSDLLKSISSAPDAATTAYGRALEAACDKYSTFISASASSLPKGDWASGQNFDADAVGRAMPIQQSQGLGLDYGVQRGQGTEGDIGNAAGLLEDDRLPWFGAMSDITGGDLLETLCFPWQD